MTQLDPIALEAAKAAQEHAHSYDASIPCDQCKGHGSIVIDYGEGPGGDVCPKCEGAGVVMPPGWDPLASAITAYLSALSPAPAEAAELVRRLDHLVSLNEPEHGGPYGGLAAQECVKAMRDAANALRRPTSPPTPLAREAALEEAAKAGWNACRKSLYAVCEDVQKQADDTRIKAPIGSAAEEQHAKGYHAGTNYAAKSIARGFNAMEAADDDNFNAAIAAIGGTK